jgi:hypothetical protein
MSNSSNDNIDIYNVDKRISDLTYENIDKHDKAMLLCRTGQPANPEDRPRNHNQKLENQYEGLKATISHQQHLLSGNCSSVIRTNCKNKWNKKFKTQEERDRNPFEKEDNDFNELEAVYKMLNGMDEKILTAEKTSTYDDDFIWRKRMNHEGDNVFELSPNFKIMQNELRDTFRAIYDIFIENGIVTNNNEEDDEITYKQKEELFLERFKEA